MAQRWVGVVAILTVASLLGDPAEGADFWVKGGLARSTLAAGDTWSPATGFTAGGFARVGLSGPTSLRMEILFTRKAARAALSDGEAEIESSMKLDYLEVPILLERTLIKRGNVAAVILGGAFGGINTAARNDFTIGEVHLGENARPDVRRGDFGVVGGVGVEFDALGRVWIAEARYALGLVTVSKEEGLDWRTRALSVTAGVRF